MDFDPNSGFRIYCRADPFYSLSARDGKVVLVPFNPIDNSQIWRKIIAGINDEAGAPTFALVNRSAGEAIKSTGVQDQPVTLVPFDSIDDLTLLWSEASDSENGYKSIRMAGNTNLYLDASLKGESASIEDGTNVVLWTRNRQKNQWWKIEKFALAPSQTFKVQTKRYPGLALAIVDGVVVVVTADGSDNRQHWYKDDKYGSDANGNRGFSLINKATGEAVRYNAAYKSQVTPVPYNPYVHDNSTIWTLVNKTGDGYSKIRPLDGNPEKFLNAHNVAESGGWTVITNSSVNNSYQEWIIAPY